MDPAEAFGKVVRDLRVKAGLTQEELAFEAGVRRTFVSVLELGQQQPSLTTVLKIAAALKIPASKLMEKVERKVVHEVRG